jgi:UDP-glucose 4-epimerase
MSTISQSIDLPHLDGKKVLITGGLGFIGSNLARRCLALGAKVTIYDSLDPQSGGNLFNVADIANDIELRFHDIANFDRISECILGKDVLFNCAASTSHPFSMKEPWVNLDVNGRGVINLLEGVRRFNPAVKFVHVGTTTQLGKLQYQPADENHPEFPMDVYSANKSVSEKYTLIYGSAYSLPVTVIRLPNVYGPRAAIHSSEFTFNNFFIGLALQGRDITVFGEGTQMRNVLYVDDAVDALIAASQSESTNHQALFAVGDKHYSVAEIAEATAKAMGSCSVRYIPWPQSRKAIDVGDAVISNQRFKSLVEWRPRIDLADGLAYTRDYFVPNLDKYIR